VTADLTAAAAVWNDPHESLESINARIHDGAPIDKLDERAAGYISLMLGLFPYALRQNRANCLEIGSGTGYLMEALDAALRRRCNPAASVTGLDIAENMLAKAQRRLAGRSSFRFIHYDGLRVPASDGIFDFIYSIAALQHVPKPYVYNLFFEMHRILKPSGFAVFHLLSFKNMPEQQRVVPWRDEIRRQIGLETGHWHHFYSREEVEYVVRVGTGFPYADVREVDAMIWTCVHKSPLSLPADFDPERYLELNPDVCGADPAQHWIEHGCREGRNWK
jgi:ubiquinone/menaquinone biosynthesis C-methylase UbiE